MFRTLFRSRRFVPTPVPTSLDAAGHDGCDASLSAALAEARDRAAADADLALTPERAAAQRAAIMARLGAVDDSRVLAFPPRAVLGLSGPELADAEALAPRRVAPTPRPALGWLLTAAAAGLVVGVGTGQGIYSDLPGAPLPSTPRVVSSSTPAVGAAAPEADGAILGEVEVVLAGRGVEELQPLDALTPTVVSLVATAGR